MKIHSLSPKEWGKAIGIGIGVSVLTGAFMFMGLKTGVSPMPKPLGLAFAETLFGTSLPLPAGLLFHTAWVTFWSVAYVALFHDDLSFLRALGLGLALWILVLVFFFPFVGWGFAGLAVGPQLIVGSLVPHLLFAVFLWGLSRMVFGEHGGRVAAH